MAHTQDTYIQQESVSAYIPHSNNAKTNFPQTTNKQPPAQNREQRKREKIPERRWRMGGQRASKASLISPSFLLLLLLSSLFFHDDKIDAGLGSACALLSRRAGLFVSQERRVCVFVGPFSSCTERNKIKLKLWERKGHWKGRWGIRTFGCPLDPATYFWYKSISNGA